MPIEQLGIADSRDLKFEVQNIKRRDLRRVNKLAGNILREHNLTDMVALSESLE